MHNNACFGTHLYSAGTQHGNLLKSLVAMSRVTMSRVTVSRVTTSRVTFFIPRTHTANF